MKSKLVTIVYNTAFYVYKFRINLIRDLKAQGFDVLVISPYDKYVEVLKSMGIRHQQISMSQYGMNPFKEVVTIYELYRILKRENPVASLHYTIKPNIFGGMAASLAGVPVINNVAGAGKAFGAGNTIFSNFVSMMYKIGLRRSKKVFFQNLDDQSLFITSRIVKKNVAERIPGSGVDLHKYSAPKERPGRSYVSFLFIGRLLKEKGIAEYLNAAHQLLQYNDLANVRFAVVGEIDSNRSYIQEDELNDFLKDPRFVYYGTVSPDEMPSIIEEADCVVLPSYYREGVPRSLLEAAAMSKPIITTDNVGCREVVDDGMTGFKIPVRDVLALRVAMQKMLSLSFEERQRMGAMGRRKIEKEFDESFVLHAYRRALQEIS